MSNNLKIILIEMFKAVGQTFTDEAIKEKDWYKKYEWTEDEEAEFVVWLSEFLKTHWQGVLIRRPSNTREAIKTAKAFCFEYGWTYKDK